MDIWCLDYETYFSDDYTLKKMTTEAYIRDTRFEALLLGVRDPKGTLAWYGQEDIPAFLASVDWSQAAILAHHAQFDGLILAHHYGIKPRLWLDTLSMARQVLGTHVSAALGSLSQHYGLEPKNVPYNLFQGSRWVQLSDSVRRMLGEGCLHDCELTWQVFSELAKQFPTEEYQVVDMTVRMFTEPVLRGDTDLLRDVWRREAARKGDLMAELGVIAEDLQSAERFAELLRAEGVEPEKKEGKPQKCLTCNGTGQLEGADKGGRWQCLDCEGRGTIAKDIYAFAKTDDFMKDSLESDDERVALLCQARLGIKSTIDQTRAERLGGMSLRGPMPVYLRYCGAHTTRWSGGDGLNWQNFRRGGDLRRAIVAPPGCSLVVLDLSQIEARILAVVAGQWDLVEKFRNGEDPYIAHASVLYGHEVYKPERGDPRYDEMLAKRGSAKQAILSGGYGSGVETWKATAKKGTYGPPVVLSDDEAQHQVNVYRSRNPAIVAYWGVAGRMLARIGGGEPLQWGPMLVKDKRVYLPNGGWLGYETLEYDQERQDSLSGRASSGSWKYRTRKGWSRIWGSKLVAETTQALARVVASQAILRIRAVGTRIAWCTHDDIVAVAPTGRAQQVYDFMLREMKRPPAWLPDLPLDAEGFIGDRYSK